ncbi:MULTISPECIES: GNAT family N-acetyltransferase [Pseudomonas]|uniref:GNAT family N-acetyltransferase n=1 Tax=Pseudomonas TaxID=286 RepID=UPI0006280C3A|nr:GNAT family N-acetyltransferase [Pseudomonas putida]KKO16817.1 hypothetical protein V520_03750 [Pseudomonas putida KG-4]
MNDTYSALDNPVWNAVSKVQRQLSLTNSLACRYLPEVAPFAATSTLTAEAFRQLRELMGQDDHVIVQSLTTLPPTEGLNLTRLGVVRQMIAPGMPSGVQEDNLLRLGKGDVGDMLRLAQSTRPGPFGKRTLEMGNYLGVRDQGRLIAMAGERMRLEGFVEISAVCVEGTHRGKGLAGLLMNALRRDIVSRGEIPFLHVLDDNKSALSLYRRLGFEDREDFLLYRLDHCA